MSSRHGYGAPPASMPRSVQVLIGLLAVVAVGGTAAFAVTFKSVSDKGELGASAVTAATATSCENPETVTVAADPSIASGLEAVAAAIPATELGCSSLSVTPQDPVLTVAAIADGSAPALWIPDSSEWLDKVSASGQEIRRISNSVASTPVVTVSAPGSEAPAAWTDVLGAPALHIGDPLTSAVSSAPIVAAFAEAQSRGADLTSISAALVPVAQAQYGNLKETGSTGRIQTVDADGGDRGDDRADLRGLSRRTCGQSTHRVGTVVRFGLHGLPDGKCGCRLGGGGRRRQTAGGSADIGHRALRTCRPRFRGADQAPPVAGGVGKVGSLVPSDPTVVTKALARYEILSRPSRALAVVDVSGSMDYMQDGVTRMAATAQAGDIAIRMFPANAQLGLWAFSVDLGEGTDYLELEPVARMDATEGDTDHRSKLLSRIDSLSSIVGGGTGLYDSVLAAYRSMQQTYDPASINSVILLTDGANDDPSSISLQELLDALTREQDPTRPVPIITIGVTDDADTDVLEQISALTGGNSHFAPTPADIPKVFVARSVGAPAELLEDWRVGAVRDPFGCEFLEGAVGVERIHGGRDARRQRTVLLEHEPEEFGDCVGPRKLTHDDRPGQFVLGDVKSGRDVDDQCVDRARGQRSFRIVRGRELAWRSGRNNRVRDRREAGGTGLSAQSVAGKIRKILCLSGFAPARGDHRLRHCVVRRAEVDVLAAIPGNRELIDVEVEILGAWFQCVVEGDRGEANLIGVVPEFVDDGPGHRPLEALAVGRSVVDEPRAYAGESVAMVKTPSSRVVPLWGPHLSTAVVEGSLVNASGTVVVVSAAAGASGCDEHEPNKIEQAKIAVTATARRVIGTRPSCLFVRYGRDGGLV